MIAETKLNKNSFIYPYFVTAGKKQIKRIGAMPGIHHFSVDELLRDAERGLRLGVNKLLLFGVGEKKTKNGSSSFSNNSIISETIKTLKKEFKNDVYIITDVCVCAYTNHGHCGILHDDYVHNDASVTLLAKMALSHAQAGADMVAPSDMMDGRIGAMRNLLDKNGFENTGIMSYAIKFASAYYGPFREAADSNPQKGDRKTYQMDFRNGREALKEAMIDEQEGADILMVKPALAYMDVITNLRANTLLPVACYNVSGEYAMVKAAAQKGWIDERNVVMETMTGFARAGADIIISYHTRDIFEKNWL
jgi:porphobilinogen synthase